MPAPSATDLTPQPSTGTPPTTGGSMGIGVTGSGMGNAKPAAGSANGKGTTKGGTTGATR
ncbi:MAG TPA: hypothetical protein VL381_01785 [Rhodocyclaceae bacterium]|nr:hypothetical protein [Rhodocyclaceae bacterium]